MTEDYVMEMYHTVIDKLMRVGYSQEAAEEAARNEVNQILKDEKTKNFLDDIENLTGGPSIKMTHNQYVKILAKLSGVKK